MTIYMYICINLDSSSINANHHQVIFKHLKQNTVYWTAFFTQHFITSQYSLLFTRTVALIQLELLQHQLPKATEFLKKFLCKSSQSPNTYPLRTWMRSVLYFRGVSSQRRTWSASRTLPSSRYSRYFCCSSKNFILWHDRKQQSGEKGWLKFQKTFEPKQNSRNHSTMPFRNTTLSNVALLNFFCWLFNNIAAIHELSYPRISSLPEGAPSMFLFHSSDPPCNWSPFHPLSLKPPSFKLCIRQAFQWNIPSGKGPQISYSHI